MLLISVNAMLYSFCIKAIKGKKTYRADVTTNTKNFNIRLWIYQEIKLKPGVVL